MAVTIVSHIPVLSIEIARRLALSETPACGEWPRGFGVSHSRTSRRDHSLDWAG